MEMTFWLPQAEAALAKASYFHPSPGRAAAGEALREG